MLYAMQFECCLSNLLIGNSCLSSETHLRCSLIGLIGLNSGFIQCRVHLVLPILPSELLCLLNNRMCSWF